MIRIESSWSGLPQAPNIIAPRQRGVTLTPVEPRVRWFMAERLVRALRCTLSPRLTLPPGRRRVDLVRIKTKSVAAATLALAVAALGGAAEAGASGTASISGNALVYAG